jgi:hypothetical protein
MIQKFQYYLDKNPARKLAVNREEAKSLMNKAILRLDYISKQETNEELLPLFLRTFTKLSEKPTPNQSQTLKLLWKNVPSQCVCCIIISLGFSNLHQRSYQSLFEDALSYVVLKV